ncbi:GNAT family N-acetyltransferase [Halioxenophilus aromaticivorans]|uniref:GNAT family N-acetyltransferase n=1 Tax=Halioxenophilus aromaticivorans TaxID=1306992 RepID=A0AAV3U1A5_9ALTE|nr:MAG: GCN5-like N-acetyltransferaser [Marinobacter sp. T13-3]
MDLEWKYSEEELDWNELSELYRIAPLGEKKPDILKKAFGASMFKCFVYGDGKLVAVGRALADGVDCSYLCDVAVHPEVQGSGLGRAVVSKLVELSDGHKKIVLYSYPGKESFYKKLGFMRMSTAMAIFQDQEQALNWGLVNGT